MATLIVVALAVAGALAQNQLRLFATIADASGDPAAAVGPTDVRVLEDGVDGKVVAVEAANWPVKLHLLVDNGLALGSQNISQLRNGVRGLIEALPEGTEVTLVSTAPQPRFVVRATTDRQAQLKGVDLLTPDAGAGRFVESLAEATQRIERDKTDYNPVIVAVGTTTGDTNVRERDVERLMQRLQQRPTTAHVVMVSSGQSAGGGGIQIEVGIQVAKFTGGRYENIAAPSRLATLLPELGAQVARTFPSQGGRYRITVERPAGKSGAFGSIGLSVRAGLKASNVTFDAP